ncbi:FadR/GntR family transcriptional regulator [Gynurincola endophyticus]|jgi:GntR family transcriptional repressor for pyruvate dehydrogenase complex|uniref:FadR/GntR family transcriptional regulator n=1 Tax=Gynurincola endophyticus TaxID=2479004 RepID=UPI000F8D4063|nr:GntR family transcriptional regulator [Gynurincola endophyticus]
MASSRLKSELKINKTKAAGKERKKNPSATMADIVETRLREYLKKKSFRPGDPLPKEMELAEALGVSRNVIREALSRLRMLGMIETKKRRGMVLTTPDILSSFERVLDPLIIDDKNLKDIFELRLVLELGLADLLYMRKTDKDIEELETIVKSENADETEFRLKNEIAFHGKLYEMTGNDTLKRFQNMLLPLFGYVIQLEKQYQPATVSHADLVKILKNGTKDEFKAAMTAHLQPHLQRLN